MSEDSVWLDLVKEVLEEHQSKGGFQVLFPSYRPDMARLLANHLDLRFYDFRQEKMQSLGWEAGNIELQEATAFLYEESSKSGVLIHNMEPLLATKTEAERQQWLADFLDIGWANPVVLPITVYQGDTLEEYERVCDIELMPFAKESFLMRLAT
jgi:hypothetical protein